MQKRFTPDAGGVFSEWEEVTLGDIAEFSRGKGLTKKDVSEKGERKCLLYGQLQVRYGTIIKNVTGMTDVELKNPVLSKSGDVLISGTISAGLAKASCIKEDGVIIGGDINILRPKEGIDGEFLARAINANTKKFKRFLEGSVILHLKNENIKEVSIRIPKSIEEQRKIAAALAAYDEMIAVKTAKLETWQECKKRMVKEIFGRTKRFKDDDGREFPKWEEKTMGDVCARVTKRNKGCKSNLLLTISAKDGIVDQKTYFNKIVASKNLENYYIIEKGEFAYNKSYSAGFKYGSIKRLDNYEEGVLSPIYICFSISDTNIVDSDYLVQYFDSMKWNDQMSVLCNEGVRNHGALNVKTEDFFAIRIPLPCMEEQQKIGSFLAEIDKEIQIQKEFIKTYVEGKKRMMRELME